MTTSHLPPATPDRHVEVSSIDGDTVRVRGLSADEVAKVLDADPHLAVERIDPVGLGDLTRRELDVLRFVAAGRSNADVANQMILSPNTVKSYIRSAYRKIEVETRSQAVRWALEHGLTSEPQGGPHN